MADAVDECMKRKIPKLMDEGKSQEQAVAAARSMCEDEHKDAQIDRKLALMKQINAASEELRSLDAETDLEAGATPAEPEAKPADPDSQAKWYQPFDQSEVNYSAYQVSDRGCASCRFFRPSDYETGGDDNCQIVVNYPDPIEPTGLCDQWTARRREQMTVDPLPVVIVEAEDKAGKSFSSRLRAMFKNFVSPRDEGFSGFKAIGDTWLAAWSNNYKDRDGEFFPERAIDDYIWRVDHGLVPLPELWDSHIPGTKSGEADMVFRIGHFAMAVGHFDDTPLGRAAKAYHNSRRNKPEGISHGFLFDSAQFKDHCYWQFNTFELSPLGAFGNAANVYATFEGVKSMPLTDEKKQRLIEKFGKDQAEEIIQQYEAKSKALDEFRIEFKEFASDSGDETAAVKAATEAADANFSELVPELLEGSLEAVTAVTAALKAVKDQTALIEAQNTKIEALEKELRLSPRASQAQETQVTPTKDEVDAIKERQTTQDGTGFNPFPGAKSAPSES